VFDIGLDSTFLVILFLGGAAVAEPKRRTSKARKRKRRANWKLEAPGLIECPQCHEPKLPHRICGSCGYYKGRPVIEIADE